MLAHSFVGEFLLRGNVLLFSKVALSKHVETASSWVGGCLGSYEARSTCCSVKKHCGVDHMQTRSHSFCYITRRGAEKVKYTLMFWDRLGFWMSLHGSSVKHVPTQRSQQTFCVRHPRCPSAWLSASTSSNIPLHPWPSLTCHICLDQITENKTTTQNSLPTPEEMFSSPEG